MRKELLVSEPELEKMRHDLYGVSVSDEKTRSVILKAYTENINILLEPHGAVAWPGLEDYPNSIEIKESQKATFYFS